ncbi:hypothetical protein SRHO_G00097300 [Serrasalmus rhombeus]
MPPKSKQDRGTVERRELEQAMGQSSSEDQATAAAQDSMQSAGSSKTSSLHRGYNCRTGKYGKARSAYVAMDISYSNDYKKVKEVILKKYEISAETYRQRFRATDIWPDETPRELYVRLKELFAKWTKPEEHTVQQMSEILILEQFMRMVSPDMAVWIKEHDPGTAEEAARLAEVYISARKSFSQWTPRPQSKSFGDGGIPGHAQSKSNVWSFAMYEVAYYAT